MPNKVYIGVDGKARRVNKLYVGVNGVARKVTKGYIGVDGVAKLFYAHHPFVSYSGDYSLDLVTHNNIAYELYTIKGNGTLVLADNVDCWMCGGGGGGAAPVNYMGGGGGGGGYTNTATLTSGSYSVEIGEGGSPGSPGGTTTVGSFSANGGEAASDTQGGNGGSGGGGGAHVPNMGAHVQGAVGTGQGVSTCPFGIEYLFGHSFKHCAGGAGGNATHYVEDMEPVAIYTSYGGNGGSNGSNGIASTITATGNTGGDYGGGNVNKNALFYGGGGGGGSVTYYDPSGDTSLGTAGSGYQGVVYLLIKADT